MESPEARIIRDIFKRYDRNARPVKTPNTTIELETHFILVNVENLVGNSHFLCNSTFYRVASYWRGWTDNQSISVFHFLLGWKASSFDNLRNLDLGINVFPSQVSIKRNRHIFKFFFYEVMKFYEAKSWTTIFHIKCVGSCRNGKTNFWNGIQTNTMGLGIWW